MSASLNSRSETSPITEAQAASYFNAVIGAAVFDLSGLPKEYFTTTESNDVSWVQTIFQALGLQSLLMSSLQLEGFRHAVVHGAEHWAIVVKQKACYTALLLHRCDLITATDSFVHWLHDLEPSTLKADPRFSRT